MDSNEAGKQEFGIFRKRKSIHNVRREYKSLILLFQAVFVLVMVMFLFYLSSSFSLNRKNSQIKYTTGQSRRGIDNSAGNGTNSSSSIQDQVVSATEECNVEKIDFDDENKHSRCNFVLGEESCSGNEFIYVFYCWIYPIFFPNVWISYLIFFAVAIFLVILSFYIIADTTDTYFSPAIIEICKYLKLPDTLAGITLLAFGNASPDLFSVLAGLFSNNAEMALSAPIGGGVFVTGVVLGSVILCSPPFVINKGSFCRDSLFYLVSITLIFVLYLLRFMIIYAGLFLIFLYLVYVFSSFIYFMYLKKPDRFSTLAFFQQRNQQVFEWAFMTKKLLDPFPILHVDVPPPIILHDQINEISSSSSSSSIQEQQEQQKNSNMQENQRNEWVFISKSSFLHPKEEKEEGEERNNENNNQIIVRTLLVDINEEEEDESPYTRITEEGIESNYQRRNKRCFGKFCDLIGWNKMSFLEKLLFIIFGWYTRFVRNITIPKTQKEDWNKLYACLTPLFGTLFFSFTLFRLFGILSIDYVMFLIPFFIINLIIGIFLSSLAFLKLKTSTPPKKSFHVLYVLLAFLTSICWIYISADLLVNTLSFIGLIIHIKPTILGITVLSWGNSFPDWVANVIVAKKGYPQMSIGACFGEPLLNSLVGIGVLFTWLSIQNWIQFGDPCHVIQSNPSLLIFFVSLIGQTILSIVVITIMRFRIQGIRRLYGLVLILVYICALILCLVATFNEDGFGHVLSKVKMPFVDSSRLCSSVQSSS